jgi:hypothetical protein
MKKTLPKLVAVSLLLLFILALFPMCNSSRNVKAQTTQTDEGIVTVGVSVRGTFLHADPWLDIDNDGLQDPHGGGPPEAPGIVDLQASGLMPGDNILISVQAKYNDGANAKPSLWEPDNPITYVYSGGLNARFIGVFSSNDFLAPFEQANRVPGAIDAGKDLQTGVTYFNHEQTDIPEDFAIIPNEGYLITIPHNAKYLFLGFDDSYYPDNAGSITFTIEKDTDGDGLVDSWEKKGIDFNKDGQIDLDLPMLGADFEHKDIFVEADYMPNRAPDPDAIGNVVASFANAPVSNPDMVNGINLHVIVDEQVPEKAVLANWGDYYSIKNKYFGTIDEHGTADVAGNVNAVQAKKLVFRYCLFVDKIWLAPPNYTCPGLAEGIPCDDFILAYGALDFGVKRDEQAAIFMHELGHTLGLHHGGNVDINYKPNYLSVMNYAFEFNDLKPTRPLDYSHGSCIDLNESCLNEAWGIGYPEVTVWRDPTGKLCTNPLGLYINWNHDMYQDLGTAKVNLNNYPDYASPAGELLTDYNDWANLVYRFRGTPLSAASAIPEDFEGYHMELTVEQIKQMQEEAKNIVVVSSPDEPIPETLTIGVVVVLSSFVTLVSFRYFREQPKIRKYN